MLKNVNWRKKLFFFNNQLRYKRYIPSHTGFVPGSFNKNCLWWRSKRVLCSYFWKQLKYGVLCTFSNIQFSRPHYENVGGRMSWSANSSEVSACHPSINTLKQLSLKLVYSRDIVTWYIILLCLLKYKGPKTLKVKQIILNYSHS